MTTEIYRSSAAAPARPLWPAFRRPAVWVGLLGLIVLACVLVLELRFWGIHVNRTTIADAPVTLYQVDPTVAAPPVVVAHGFAGSRQMMDQISVTLARQGFFVAALDLPGHGRNPSPMSPDITNLEGTTAELVEVVSRVASALSARPDTRGPVSFVGHSMSSDVVIRAAQAAGDVGPVVAVSMYSPAVTATSPRSLLVLSGAFEGHLREAGLEAVRQLSAGAGENETITEGEQRRRSAVAPFVGHVGVLYAPTSLNEISLWLRDATGAGQEAALDRSGWVAGLLLLSLVLLVRPVAALMPARATEAAPELSRRTILACLIVPIPVAVAGALAPIIGVAGNAAFGSLAAILGATGLVQLAILLTAGARPAWPEALGSCVYLGLAVIFALALDRYGAAFLPVGDRLTIGLVLLVGTLPLMLADTILVQGAPLLRRLLVRLSLLLALALAFVLSPTQLGLAFTVLPVLVLFFLVYGSMARWIARRRGSGAVSLGKAVILAWAIAASTPLFAVVGMP